MLSSTNGIDSTGNAQIVAVTGGGGATLEENATSETTTTEKAKSSFPELEIFTLVKEMVDGTFNEITTYQHSKISAKNEELSAKIVQQLARLPNKYKFVGNLDTEKVLMKNVAGFHATTSALWSPSTDGYITYNYQNESYSVVVHVYALSI